MSEKKIIKVPGDLILDDDVLLKKPFREWKGNYVIHISGNCFWNTPTLPLEERIESNLDNVTYLSHLLVKNGIQHDDIFDIVAYSSKFKEDVKSA